MEPARGTPSGMQVTGTVSVIPKISRTGAPKSARKRSCSMTGTVSPPAKQRRIDVTCWPPLPRRRSRRTVPPIPRFYGNFPLMVDPTIPLSWQPFHFEAHHIAQDSNLAAFHMEWFGVPWREFASGQAPAEAWLREMDAIRGLQQRLGLPVYLALTPIGGSRDRLAPNAAGTYALTTDDSFGAPCEAIDARPDYATVIRPGFRNYVSYMIRRFQPRFVALSIEVDLYTFHCPAAWNAMKRLINETYDM
jgi:hypothetical protein